MDWKIIGGCLVGAILSAWPALARMTNRNIPESSLPHFSRIIGIAFRLASIAVLLPLYLLGKFVWERFEVGSESEESVRIALMIAAVLIMIAVVWYWLRQPKIYRKKLTGGDILDLALAVFFFLAIQAEDPLRLEELAILAMFFVLLFFLLNPTIMRLYQKIGTVDRVGIVASAIWILLALLSLLI